MNTTSETLSSTQLEGLSVLLTGSGAIEIHRSIQYALTLAGCNVFWSLTEPNKETFDHPIDIVFHLGIFNCGNAYIDRLRKNLDINNPEAVIIDLPMTHPIIDTISLGLNSVSDINQFLKARRIIEWTVCSTTLKEWEKYGLCNGIFVPLGLSKYFLLGKDLTEATGNWINKDTELLRFAGQQQKGSDILAELPLVKNKIVFAGAPELSWEKFIPAEAIKKFHFLTENFLPNSKEVFEKLTDTKIEQDNIEGFLHYHYSWSISIPLERRRKMVSLVSKYFKNHVSIWGDGWDKYIENTHSTSLTPRYYYDEAMCCLDFGSLGVDTPLFGRTCEIIKGGGLLISGVSGGNTELIKENEFETSEQMLDIIEETFDPIKRQEKLEQQTLLHSKYDLDKLLREVIMKARRILEKI